MIVLFIGPHGSGKDTQAEIFEDNYGYKAISTGALIREEISRSTDFGRKLKEVYDQGGYHADEDVYKLLENYLQNHNSENVIFTGAVRRATQIPLLDKHLKNAGKILDRVIYFNISDQAVVDRLAGRVIGANRHVYHLRYNPPPKGMEYKAREDDKPEAIINRNREFHKSNEPIIEVYKEKKILSIIDASKSISEVTKDIKKILKLK